MPPISDGSSLLPPPFFLPAAPPVVATLSLADVGRPTAFGEMAFIFSRRELEMARL